MLDFVKGWECPTCNAKNADSFFHVRVPVCWYCSAEFLWDDLLSERMMRLANKYLAAYQAERKAKK